MTSLARQGWFHSVDIRTKLVAIALFVVVSALLTDVRLIGASLTIGLAMAALSGTRPRTLLKAYAITLPLIFASSASVLILTGVWNGLAMFMRTSSCIIPLLVLVNGTDSFSLFGGLRGLGVPAVFTTLLMLTHRFVLLIGSELSRMKIARRARGFRGGRSLLDRYGLSVLSNTAGMTLVRADGRAERIFEGMKARGFRGVALPSLPTRPNPLDFVFAGLIVSSALALALFQIGGFS